MNLLQYQQQILASYLEQIPEDQQDQFLQKYKELDNDKRNQVLVSLASAIPELNELVNGSNEPTLEFMPGGIVGLPLTPLNKLEDFRESGPLIQVDEEGYYYNIQTGKRVILDGKEKPEEITIASASSPRVESPRVTTRKRDTDIMNLQRFLVNNGLYLENTSNQVDGIAGSKTRAALKNLLDGTGIVPANVAKEFVELSKNKKIRDLYKDIENPFIRVERQKEQQYKTPNDVMTNNPLNLLT